MKQYKKYHLYLPLVRGYWGQANKFQKQNNVSIKFYKVKNPNATGRRQTNCLLHNKYGHSVVLNSGLTRTTPA